MNIVRALNFRTGKYFKFKQPLFQKEDTEIQTSETHKNFVSFSVRITVRQSKGLLIESLMVVLLLRNFLC